MDPALSQQINEVIKWAVGINLGIVSIICTAIYFMTKTKLDISAFGTFTVGYENYIRSNEERLTVLINRYELVKSTQIQVLQDVAALKTCQGYLEKEIGQINDHIGNIDSKVMNLTEGFTGGTIEAIGTFKDALNKQISLNEKLISDRATFEKNNRAGG